MKSLKKQYNLKSLSNLLLTKQSGTISSSRYIHTSSKYNNVLKKNISKISSTYISNNLLLSINQQQLRNFHHNKYQLNPKQKEDKKNEKEENNDDDDDANGKEREIKFRKRTVIILALATVYLLLYTSPSGPSPSAKRGKEITFQEFVDRFLGNTNLDHLEYDLRTNEVYVYLKDPFSSGSFVYKNKEDNDKSTPVFTSRGQQKGSIWGPSSGWSCYLTMMNVDSFETRLQDAEIEKGVPTSMSPKIVYTGSLDYHVFLPSPFTLFLVGLFLLPFASNMRMPGLGGITKTPEAVKQKVKVSFNDVAGMEEAKAEIKEFVSFLQNPNHYKKLGAKIPRGALLMGPPGTGKTLLAKAVAGETDVPFFSMSGSDFVEMFVGVGPARVRNLFKKARESGQAIIFIDEIDAIGRPRGNSMYGGGNDERENTLNQLLVEMDGFNENHNVIVLASTNVDIDGLDRALLRPGRFDRQITIDKPDQAEREAIFKVHLQKIKKAPNFEENIPRLAELTPGFAGADIANVVNEGAIFAAREGKKEVDMEDMERAIDRVIGGIEKRTAPITAQEKKVIAYHEAGHALVSWFCKYSDPLLKISIIPRGKALGYAQYVPKEHYIRTYDHLIDFITQALGGRVAEKIIFGHLSTGAQDDLQKVTRIAYACVSAFGMSEEIGPVSYPLPGDQSMAFQKPYSEVTAEKIDNEVKVIIETAFKRTEELLRSKMDLLEKVAHFLLQKETINIEQFREVVGPSPFEDKEKKFQEFVEKKAKQTELSEKNKQEDEKKSD
ncbi:hypothetical protein ABK040_001739 [Willaertia magna]